jgi:hypothetical protein
MAPRHAFELTEQVIVEPLPRSLGVDLLVAHGRRPARLGGVFLRWIQ